MLRKHDVHVILELTKTPTAKVVMNKLFTAQDTFCHGLSVFFCYFLFYFGFIISFVLSHFILPPFVCFPPFFCSSPVSYVGLCLCQSVCSVSQSLLCSGLTLLCCGCNLFRFLCLGFVFFGGILELDFTASIIKVCFFCLVTRLPVCVFCVRVHFVQHSSQMQREGL